MLFIYLAIYLSIFISLFFFFFSFYVTVFIGKYILTYLLTSYKTCIFRDIEISVCHYEMGPKNPFSQKGLMGFFCGDYIYLRAHADQISALYCFVLGRGYFFTNSIGLFVLFISETFNSIIIS